MIPVRIEYDENGQIFVAVHQYQSLSVDNDPFLRYPALRAKLWSTRLHDSLDIIDKNMFGGQYASWTIPYPVDANTSEATVIMSLSRVRYMSIQLNFNQCFAVL